MLLLHHEVRAFQTITAHTVNVGNNHSTKKNRMKNITKILQISLILVLIWSCNNSTKIKKKSEEIKTRNHKVEKSQVTKKLIETNFETQINEKSITELTKNFGLEIENIDYNNYKIVFKKDTLILTNELHETIQGKRIKISNEIKIQNAKIKIEFGFNQYTIDDNPSQPLKFGKTTKWLDLIVENDFIEIPELYNNSNAHKISELLNFKNNSEIIKWIEKKEFDTIKSQSIIEQERIYSKILLEKEKYEKCCPEYIKQATDFVNRKDEKKIDDLHIELIIKSIVVELSGNNGKLRRVIIDN